MPRLLITDPLPFNPADVPSDALAVTPGRCASDAIGRSAVDLRTMAKGILRRKGIGLATPIQSTEALRRAAAEIFGKAVALAAARHMREILGAALRSGIDLDAFEAAATPRIRPAAKLARRYAELLREVGLVDSEASLAEVLRLAEFPRQKVFVYGYFRGRGRAARPEEFEFIDRIAGDGSIFYLPCGDGSLFNANREWAAILTSRGWSQTHEERDETGSAGSVLASRFAGDKGKNSADVVPAAEAISFANIEDEVRSALGRAKSAAIAGVRPGRIAIVCRDMQLYAPTVISVAREYDLAVEIDHAVAIAETVVGEFISLLLDVVDLRDAHGNVTAPTRDHHRGFLFESTLRLLRHRFGPGIGDVEFLAARAARPRTLESWRAITGGVDILNTDGDRDRMSWVHWLHTILAAWNVRTRAAAEARELAALNAFLDAIDELARESGNASVSIAEFAGEIFEVLADVKTPAHTAAGGVRVLQPNSVAGGEFDEVYVLGMAEGIFPTPAADDNVLDFCERRTLADSGVHFEDPLEVPRWEAQSFYCTLLASRGRLVLSYPRYAEGRELIASSYFDRIGMTPGPSTVDRVSSLPEYRRAFLTTDADGDEVLARARHQYGVEMRRESAAAPDEYDGVTGIPVNRRKWNATSLTRLGTCPFKWFADDVLRLGRNEDADGELRPDVRGRLYHKALELAVKRASETGGELRRAILDVLDESFANAEELDVGLRFVENWELRRSEHLEKLRIAVEAEDFVADGASVIEAEREFRVEFSGLLITGTIDRIDRYEDGRIFAVDYKSGKSIARIKDENGILTLDLQMPLYCSVALPQIYPEATAVGGAFFSISEGKRTPEKEVDLETVVLRLMKHVETGSFPVDPDVRQKACEHCEYDMVCRRGLRLSKKKSENGTH